MVSYHYLNRFFIERLPARSGCFKLSRDCDSKQHQAASRDENTENSAPNQDLHWKLQERFIKSLRPRKGQRRGSIRLRCKRFVRLDKEMMLPNVLYAISSAMVSMLLLFALSGSQVLPASGYLISPTSAPLARQNTRSAFFPSNPAPMLPPLGIDWRRIGSQFLNQFDRLPWRSPSSGSTLDDSTSSTRLPLRRVDGVTRVINRLRQRIGARNTIRVHNAFRDFAWRLLGSLSMPTPVIYELRRQNFYPPEEDALNDHFYNRNTSKTIRSKRLFGGLEPAGARSADRRASKSDDDDDEPETLRERLRTRLEDMLSLSRRSLFGRVVRLPSLFPFKRQEEEDGDERTDGATGKARQRATGSQRPRLASLASSWKKRRDLDRQIIEINGKQFYVDEDGELKELKEPT